MKGAQASGAATSSGPVADRLSGRTDRAAARLGIAVAIAVTLVGLVLLWVWTEGAEGRAVRRLPDSERRALYERTLRSLQTPCGAQERAADLSGFCRKQAEFALLFPECDEACAAKASAHIRTPTR